MEVEAGFAGFAIAVGFAGESLCGTGIDALAATAAALIYRRACGREGRVGEDGGPAHARPDFGRDEQAIAPDPAETGQVRGQLVRELTALIPRVDGHRRGDGHRAMSRLLQHAAHPRRDVVETPIDEA